ncbi:FtsW/RodA/SpoVE family cell cycle protein [Henriciella litoralis]|uniref:FtsW/RodA/SpoVE family cell cycle protein n=1 Tax=Henriciella litoralis TaxID=568102 RepID=UPI000A06BEF3|nr:putative peptidoglycan glycosyltransferase FtsW [Henriciella litoralis]
MTTQYGQSVILPRSDRSVITEWRRSVDWQIIAASVTLLALGLVLSLAAGPPAADRLGYDDLYYFVKRQSVFAGAAVIVLFGASLLNRTWARRGAAIIFCVSLVLLVAILIFGHEAKGAQRWIQIAGFTIQPSESVKPALIILSAWLLAQRQLYPGGPWAIVALVFFVVTLGLLLLQPDVGQSALLTAAFMVTFFISGMPWKWAAAFIGGGFALCLSLYSLLPHVRYRVNSFINPSDYDTYQIDKASEAISRGGLLGAGPGEGTVKSSLPDAHTDFIYSVLGEEFGYVAALALIALYVFICWRGLRGASQVRDPYPRAAAAGLFALFGLQAAINIAVNVSLIPPKGMTLPFISYGGSSMMGIALTLGLGLALIRRQTITGRRRYV